MVNIITDGNTMLLIHYIHYNTYNEHFNVILGSFGDIGGHYGNPFASNLWSLPISIPLEYT